MWHIWLQRKAEKEKMIVECCDMYRISRGKTV